ncbi:hypothetical protein [Rhizobacter fulvus]
MSHPSRIVGDMKPTEFHLWMIRDERTGKLRKTRYLMTAATALQRHPEASTVPGTCEVRDLPENDDEMRANTTSSWQRNG